MSMMTNTLGRYFAGRFLVSAVGVFASIFLLLVLVDYIEMVRKTSGLVSVSAIKVAQTSLYRVPQLLEKMMPFCVLIGAMTCYLALSRRLELVVARAAGVSAWQFIAPALAARSCSGYWRPSPTIRCRPILRELSKRMEAELFGSAPGGGVQDASGFWLNQVNSEGQWIINAARSEQQGVRLTGLTVFRFDNDFQFKERIEAREASARGRPLGVQRRAPLFFLDSPPVEQDNFFIADQPDPGPGPQQFFHPRNCVFLATTELYPVVGEFGLRDRRVPVAVPQAHCTAVFAGCNGDAGGFREPALLPDGRRSKDGFEWRGRRLSALRSVESN